MLPAVGQGAMAIEIRADDASARAIIAPLDDEPTARATAAERAFLARLEGGCQIPIGTHARMEPSGEAPRGLVLDALVGSLDGATVLRGTRQGMPEQAEEIGRELAEELLGRGAGDILRAIRREAGPAGDESQR